MASTLQKLSSRPPMRLNSILIYFWNKIDPEEEILKTSVRDSSLSFRYVEKATYRFWPIVRETVQTGVDCFKGFTEE